MRKSYGGAVPATVLQTDLAIDGVALTLADPTGWIDGSEGSGPFTVVIDRGQASGEEKLLCTSRTGASITIASRGYDGTSPAKHDAGASVEHCWTATDANEANAHVNQTTGAHGITGLPVGTGGPQTLTEKTLTAPVIDDLTDAQHDHTTAEMGGNIPQAAVTGLVTALTAITTADAAASVAIAANKTSLAGDQQAVGTPHLDTLGEVKLVASSKITVTAGAVPRRVLLIGASSFTMASGSFGNYFLQCGYDSTLSGVATATGTKGHVQTTQALGAGHVTGYAFATPLVPANKSVDFYISVCREVGGNASDTAFDCELFAIDIGSV